ncbi:hypothetical protein [Magnetospira thiophila]
MKQANTNSMTSAVWLDETALRIISDQKQQMFGRWDRLFGCWQRENEQTNWLEEIPNRPMFSPQGRMDQGFWPDRDIQGGDKGAVIAYLLLIPAPLRRLVAPLGPFQWLALDLIWLEPQVATWIDDLGAAEFLVRLEHVLVGLDRHHLNRQQRSLILDQLAEGKQVKAR